MFIKIPGFDQHLLDDEKFEIFSIKENKYISATDKGYLILCLSDGHRKYHKPRVHRIIYEMYKGKIPKGYIIHHIDGNKLNNNPNNLIAIPREEHPQVHNNIPIVMLSKKGEFIKEYASAKKAAEEGFNPSHISKCCQRTRKSHKGCTFMFKSEYYLNRGCITT